MKNLIFLLATIVLISCGLKKKSAQVSQASQQVASISKSSDSTRNQSTPGFDQNDAPEAETGGEDNFDQGSASTGSRQTDSASMESEGSGTSGGSGTIAVESPNPGSPTVALSPPTQVIISPAEIFSNEDATCEATPPAKPEGVSLEYKWSINGGAFGNTGATLSSTNFFKSDNLTCSATTVLGTIRSQPAYSQVNQVENAGPLDLTGASITSPLFTDANEVVCGVSGESTDADDDEVTVYYSLEKSESDSFVTISGPSSGESFSGVNLSEGDLLRCKVYTSDGTKTSNAVFSESVTVGVHYRYFRFRLPKIDSGASANLQASFGIEFFWDGQWQESAMSGPSSGTIGSLAATVSSANENSRNYEAYRAFDGSENYATERNSYSSITGNELSPQWVQMDLGESQKKNIKGLRISGLTHLLPIHFFLEASDDEITWIQVSPSYELNSAADSVSGKDYIWP